MNSFLQHLVGTWFIIGTNFPMWLKGDKTNPTFNYSIAEKDGKTVLYDEVKYLKKGKAKVICGYDHQNVNNEKAFLWRGKGLLGIAKSNWEVRLLNEEQGWAVIWFSKTLFTPEGVDIISRNKILGPIILQEIKNKMKMDSVLKQHVNSLIILR